MEGAPQYLLDTNVFVEAARRYYPLDFAQPFWDGLKRFGQNQQVGSCDRVLAELKKGNDALKVWALNEFEAYFASTQSPEVLEAYAQLVQWAQAQRQFKRFALDEFMREKNADTWLIALALATQQTVVTHEVYSAEAKKRIPIPNVCRAFDIPYCDTFQMLRALSFKF